MSIYSYNKNTNEANSLFLDTSTNSSQIEIQEEYPDILDFSLIEVKDEKVNARGLWQFLRINKKFSDWVKYQIESLELKEGIDFHKIGKPAQNNVTDYLLTIDMAKHLAMVTRNEQGKKARIYFLECEKKLKETPKKLSTIDILQLAIDEIKQLKKETEELALENSDLASRDLNVITQKEYKWKKQELLNDRGRTINYFVNRKFWSGSYSASHKKSKEAYTADTGKGLPDKSEFFSLEQKKEYLEWLSKVTIKK